ncbi:MAG: hypothetical protein ACTSXP_06735, partial [Promethearchaeota archaeon]
NDFYLMAIPFRVQPDVKEYYFTMADLKKQNVFNPDFKTDCQYCLQVIEDARELRSEVWYLGTNQGGLLIIKYNQMGIEYSVFSWDERYVFLGGASTTLYGEPGYARTLEKNEMKEFGMTRYIPISGDDPERLAMEKYREFLEMMGHFIPIDYDPPVHWNVLYNVGWWHSDFNELKKHYTRESLLAEAKKALDCHAQALYLDPGWETCEGETIWDAARLGPMSVFVDEIKAMGLSLSIRTILRDYKGWIPEDWIVKHERNDLKQKINLLKLITAFREGCIINPDFWNEKLERILKIAKSGLRFIMFDEMDWRGPCHSSHHSHEIPSTAAEHVDAVYDLCKRVRQIIKEETGDFIIIEAHDPVWSWGDRYTPTYYRQGFGYNASFQENWGFEFMWNPLVDLRTGKALTLYYYACAVPIPLYLHFTMIHDNKNCLFFWWAASTVRHIGIGGSDCNETICPSDMAHAVESKAQFERYAESMKEYLEHKKWFCRDRFIGINEECHLHLLECEPGAVVIFFNIFPGKKEESLRLEWGLINSSPDPFIKIMVKGDNSHQIQITPDSILIKVSLIGESVARVYIGSACSVNPI